MKKTLLFFLLLISFKIYAQLDNKHWFAPMIDRVSNSSNNQSIYLSTDKTTPFEVRIYNNNQLIQKVNISKGNPIKYDVPRHHIITTNSLQVFTVNTMGLYVEGDYPFFANLRFSTKNHGEFITSKGTSGIGTEFFTVMAPITVSNNILNFMTGILATEDNTEIKITGYNPNVVFSDNVSRSEFTINLNKGQSYIIDGKGNIQQNFNGFIGAKIKSNKPISVTNGNFNGQYAGNYPLASDILMDQAVPVTKLGKEYILVKGNGRIGHNTEKPIIVATKDNTQVYLNDSPTPIITLAEGKFYHVPDTAYRNAGNGHYNLYIRTTEDAYVYQLLAGDSGSSSEATGGMNLIPPLSCYLPTKIDEIGNIDENYVVTNDNPWGILKVPTKLNIITEVGATVRVNGNLLNSSQGPFNVSGNSDWVTYSVSNISGNVTIESTKAVTGHFCWERCCRIRRFLCWFL